MSHTYYDNLRLVNLLGALCLSADDVQYEALVSVSGSSGAAPAAIVTIGTFPGQSIDELRSALGITHAGAVRLVDGLVVNGKVDRQRAGRTVSLSLTEEGERLKQELLNGRGEALMGLLGSLDEAERRSLESLLRKMLTGYARERPQPRYHCRLCDRHVCSPCPVSRGAVGEDDPLGSRKGE